MIVASVWATPINTLNFNHPTVLPTGYTYSATNTPVIADYKNEKCVYVTNGGSTTYPGGSTPDASKGKRWMGFVPDEDCSVVIRVGSGKKVWKLQDNGADFATFTNTVNTNCEDWTVTGLKAGHYYVLGGPNSQMYVASMTFTATSPSVSTDATLSDLKVDGQTVSGFAAGTTTYNVTIPATQTTDPVVSATKNDSKAGDPVISQATLPTPGQPTTATVTVTAEDGTTTKTYTINFTRAELSHDADLKDIQVNGTSITGFAAGTTSYNVTVPFSATTNTVVTATTNNTAAQVVVTGPNAVIGTATIVVTAEDGTTTKTYTVNITKAAASSDATLSALQYNGTSVPNFSANTLTYSVELPYGTTAAAQVTATANYSAANVQITQPTAAAGSATIVVTAEDGTTTKTYTITFTVAEEPADPIIPTTPGVHSPGVYVWDKEDGGYGQQFVTYNNEQYEVFYINRDGTNSKLGISTSNADKGGFFPATGTDDKKFAASDNWIVANTNGRGGDTDFAPKEEFKQSVHCAKFQAGYSMEMKVRGYSEFALVAKDNNADVSKGRYFVVTIDGQNQAMTPYSNGYTIRRFALSAEQQHTIKVSAVGASDGKMVAFSLKVGTTPDMPAPVLEKFSGKDSGQVVYQSQQIIPISYRVKYNRKTELEWVGNAATGINISTRKGPKYDTIRVEGTAQCPIGNYHYRIVTKVNNQPVMSKDGYFEVKSKIWATTDTVVNGWTGQAIRRIQFRYYALSDANVHIQWTGAAPAGITASGQDGVYTISGQTATAGTYFFTISVDGGNSVQGKIVIKNFNPGSNPILYLYKGEYEDGIYSYLKSAGKNPIEMEQNGELRTDYSIYTMIIISESCDATDGEVLAVARGEANKPVLNMKSFTYAPGRLDWGEPDNGSLINREIIVRQPSHPIFTKMGKQRGDAIVVLDSIIGTGLMPVAAQMNGTLCLATAMTRGRDYTDNGKDETFLHEIPATMRGGKKYLTFPVSTRSSEKLSRDGKNLLLGCIDYLLSNEPTIKLPELEITEIRVKLDSTYYYGEIDNEKNEIIITVPADMDLTHLVPEVTIKDAINSHVDPAPGTELDMSDSFFGVDFTVSDFVNQRIYNVRLIVETGLEEILEEEGWVNIYDIRGQKVTTTNDIRGLSLPSGIYIVVGQKGSRKISVQ